MSNEQKLRGMIHVVSRFVDLWYERHDELRGMYHAEMPNGQPLLIPTPPIPKDEGVALIRELFAERGIVRYVFLDEAWTLDTTRANVSEADFARAMREGLRDFDHPARCEMVMITAEDRERQMLARREIIRPAVGRLHCGPLTIDERPMMSAGRMVGLLQPQGTRQ
jgi:hypothetical protein